MRGSFLRWDIVEPASGFRILNANFLSESVRSRLAAYEGLIRSWSEKFNLVSKGDLKKIWARHFEDALMLSKLFPDWAFESAIDVGSGAGFPGIPIKVSQPDLRLVLAESVGKKCVFMKEAVTSLALSQCEVVCERAESLGRDQRYREKFDAAFARALAHPDAALELVASDDPGRQRTDLRVRVS